jgi:hypothetical protein
MFEVLMVGYALSYIAVIAARALVEWECRRGNSPAQRRLLIQEMLRRIEREQALASRGFLRPY